MVVDYVRPKRTLEFEGCPNTPAIILPLEAAGVADHSVHSPVCLVCAARYGVKERTYSILVNKGTTVPAAAIQMVDGHLLFRRVPQHGRMQKRQK